MRIVISGFICGLVFVTTVLAAPVTTTTTDSQVISEADVVAAGPQQDLVPQTFGSPANQSLGEEANKPTPPEVVSNVEIPQQVNQQANAREKVLKELFQEKVSSREPLPTTTVTQEVQNVAISPSPTQEVDPIIKNLTDRLATLETQNATLQDQITQINARVSLLEERVIGNVGEQKSQEHLQNNVGRLKNYIGPKLFTIIISSVVVIFLLLLIYIIFPRRRSITSVNYPQDNLPNKEYEFNPMEGQEGNVAKLNLARAYIEMGDKNKAQEMLYNVLAHGNDSDQREAKALLEKVTKMSP